MKGVSPLAVQACSVIRLQSQGASALDSTTELGCSEPGWAPLRQPQSSTARLTALEFPVV
jgi:hypothetical protein